MKQSRFLRQVLNYFPAPTNNLLFGSISLLVISKPLIFFPEALPTSFFGFTKYVRNERMTSICSK